MARFYIENFGCRATQADGAALERQFLDRGLDRAASAGEAEIVVLNTCTVTEGADKDARASLRRLQRVNPDCRVLVTGCYAQRAPQEVAALPGVTWVIGNSHKHLAAEIATRPSSPPAGSALGSAFVPLAHLQGRTDLPPEIVVGDIFAHTELLAAPVFDSSNERTRPNLKVQDGCDNRCSFCVIPSVRGQSRSLPLERVLAEVRSLVAAGYREVVLSGINLGRWGRDLPALVDRDSRIERVADETSLRPTTGSPRLASLIRAILHQTSLRKLRISSVEPMDWTDELIALVASSSRIAQHGHVPMQSGSDAVLRRMRRKYRPWHYREKILKIRKALPNAAIGADVMVGFPGETDAEFNETWSMVEELPFTYLHVFTYSARPGTPAAGHSDQVAVAVARERNRALRELASRKKSAFMHSLVGSEIEAITLQSSTSDFTEALTDNYLKMRLSGAHAPNRWTRARVEGVAGDVLVAKPVIRTESATPARVLAS